ncbi:double zinc ribbon domain-containing protein [Salinibaculum salinum]|uniref:double zinc ribbon domain-containing protein n=1 Tax=Salinibaculum salinum TaxID=3131996 RepID=UPI0030EDBF7A
MSKITFRADDDLIRRLEEFDASKSEVMRDALREYLDGASESSDSQMREAADPETLDDLVAERVDALIADRLERTFTPRQPQDINVNIALDGDSAATADTESDAVNVDSGASDAESEDVSHASGERMTDEGRDENTAANGSKTCAQCGENIASGHVYCPNCGEKSSRRVFCDCGDELRSDWAFCPGCGRRTPAADVLEQG